MSIVEDALLWDGVYANIGMYALFEGDLNLQECSFATGDVEPIKAWPPFLLEDELNTLPEQRSFSTTLCGPHIAQPTRD